MDAENAEQPQEEAQQTPRQTILSIIMHEKCMACISAGVKAIVDLYVFLLIPAWSDTFPS